MFFFGSILGTQVTSARLRLVMSRYQILDRDLHEADGDLWLSTAAAAWFGTAYWRLVGAFRS